MKIKRYSGMLLLLGVLFLAGCGDDKAGKTVTGNYYNPAAESQSSAEKNRDTQEDGDTEQTPGTENDAEEEQISADLFLITSNDMQSQCLIMKQMASGKQYMYNYSAATTFADKYGNHTSVSYFEPGRVVTIGEKDVQGRVLKVQISDKVWEYPDVTKYDIDEERGVFDIAGTKYSFDEGIYVNSDGNPENLSDLKEMDILRVVGIGKKILSVSVTTGHGELELTNTDLFEGSFIQVGSEIFAEITPDMTLELPEGTYTVAVANKGYGGNTEVEIERGNKYVLDLDTLKGDGPQTGYILFAIDVEDAVLQIDGETVDYHKEVPLQYGVHTLTVTADSYETYSKKLYVNSKESTIVISMTGSGTPDNSGSGNTNEEDDADNEEDSDNEENPEANAGNLAGSLAGSHSGAGNTNGNTNGNTSFDEAELNAIIDEMLNKDKDDNNSSNADYLSTLTELILALKGAGD